MSDFSVVVAGSSLKESKSNVGCYDEALIRRVTQYNYIRLTPVSATALDTVK
jgi:hypothetical protein